MSERERRKEQTPVHFVPERSPSQLSPHPQSPSPSHSFARKEASCLAACLVAEHRAWSRLSCGHLTEERERHAVSIQADRAIVWLRA